MLVVVSHEFGHFIIARINGIKVVEFTIGLGPALFKKRLKSGMLFAIRLLPIGGACIFDGEDGAESTISTPEEANLEIEPGVLSKKGEIPFTEAPVGARIASVFAGPLFNLILAFLLSMILCWFCGTDLPVLQGLMEGYPAEAAGLQSGDVIRKINSERIYVWREVSMISMLSVGKPLEIEYERNGEVYETVITPMYSEEDDRYYIGFRGAGEFIDCNNISVFKYSALEVRFWLLTTIRSLGYMIGGHGSKDDLAGPVGVATVIDETIEENSVYGLSVVILQLINITVLLSVNLGVMNLLPIPALDGGRLLFLFIEAVRGKKIPPEKEGIVHLIGMILLLILIVFVFFNDIMRLFH